MSAFAGKQTFRIFNSIALLEQWTREKLGRWTTAKQEAGGYPKVWKIRFLHRTPKHTFISAIENLGGGYEADGTPTDLVYIVPDLQRENLSFRTY